MNEPGVRGRIGILAAVTLLVALFFFNASAHFDYTPDDSYIYFRYAVNLASGEGFSFNPGEASFGFTSPLWLGILSGASAAGADVELAGKALDLLFASLSIVIFFLVAYEMTRDPAVAFLGTLAWSVNAWLLRWAGSGLETSLAVFLLLAGVLFLLRNRYRESFLILGLLILTRPEAALLVIPFAADYLYNLAEPPGGTGGAGAAGGPGGTGWAGLAGRLRHGAWGLAALAGLTALVVVPWAIISWTSLGTLIPSTLQAKQGAPGIFDPGELLSALKDLIVTLGSADGATILVLAGSLAAARLAGIRADLFARRQGLASLIWIVLLPAAYVLMNVNIVSRYLLIVTPLIGLLAYFHLQRSLSRIGRPLPRALIVFAATGLILIQNQYIYATHVRPHLSAFTAGMEESLIPIARYLETNSAPGSVIFAGDVGALGYFSKRSVCDYNGIVSPVNASVAADRNVAHPSTMQEGSADSAALDEDGFTKAIRNAEYRSLCAADYVLHRSSVPDALASFPHLVPVMSRPFGQLSISNPETAHYTLYRTVDTPDVAVR